MIYDVKIYTSRLYTRSQVKGWGPDLGLGFISLMVSFSFSISVIDYSKGIGLKFGLAQRGRMRTTARARLMCHINSLANNAKNEMVPNMTKKSTFSEFVALYSQQFTAILAIKSYFSLLSYFSNNFRKKNDEQIFTSRRLKITPIQPELKNLYGRKSKIFSKHII